MDAGYWQGFNCVNNALEILGRLLNTVKESRRELNEVGDNLRCDWMSNTLKSIPTKVGHMEKRMSGVGHFWGFTLCFVFFFSVLLQSSLLFPLYLMHLFLYLVLDAGILKKQASVIYLFLEHTT